MRTLALACILAAVAAAVSASAAEAEFYRCPMHPAVTADAPATCPICGMRLVRARRAARTPEQGGEASPAPSGAVVEVAPGMVQALGVRTARAAVTEFSRSVRAFGRVAPSTRRESVVAARVAGWIEHLAVAAEGDAVAPGDLLYRVYSPDLIAAQRDYRDALRGGDAAPAALRLRSLGMQEAALRAVREQGVMEQAPVYAATGGVVAALPARRGAYLRPGDLVMRIQDYGVVWIIADIAEQDLSAIAVGARAALAVRAAPGAPRAGVVDYVYPTVDARTRTGRVRLVVDNPQGALRPGAYADVTFEIADRPRLSVPSEAVLRDARGAHVVRALGGGRFAPQAVVAGLVGGGRTEIRSGLRAGDAVVASGQFLLDSEANLREGLAKLAGAGASDAQREREPRQHQHRHRH